MLKLLKYEWKACARTCLPLYGVLILMSLISRILYVIPKNASLDFMLPAISSMLYMGVMMAAFVVTAVILIQRFYKNLLGSEGYLMFTLPVTVSQHLLSKTIIAVVMIGLSGLSALISIFIFADRMILSMDEVWQAFTGLSTLLPHSGQEFLFELELLVLAVLGIAGMAPVSYTHLDVYKRQEHNHNLSAQTENQIVHLRHCTDGARQPAFGRHAARILSAAGHAACLRGLLRICLLYTSFADRLRPRVRHRAGNAGRNLPAGR